MQDTMSDKKVHPTLDAVSSSDALVPPASTLSSSSSEKEKEKQPGKKSPPKGTYVIQLPKEQIFSYPPPENAKNYDILSRRKPRRSCCRVCLCVTISLLLFLILVIGIAAAVLYFVLLPKAPKYAILDVSISGMNLTSSSSISPAFNVSIRAENPNKKIGIYYLSGSEVKVSHGDVGLSNGTLPVFYQPSNNVTVFETVLKGSNVILANPVRLGMENEQKQANVPFTFNIKAPVKIKVGGVKTWKITVKVKCDVNVDALNEKAKIVSKDCDYNVKLW